MRIMQVPRGFEGGTTSVACKARGSGRRGWAWSPIGLLLCLGAVGILPGLAAEPRVLADHAETMAARLNLLTNKPMAAAAGSVKGRGTVTDQDRQFWAFRPVSRVEPPVVRLADWIRTPIDQFILAKLEEKQLSPSPVASRRALIRRAYLDLIGLPPTPEEVAAFEQDPARDAYDRVLDHLLASPHYGERWGRHWLDLARFAESHGFEHDYDRTTAYHYRDFVIQALNLDMPYDQFVQWQIAGDEIDPENPLALKATGFLAAGVHATQITANQVEKERYDELDDMASITGTAMLGMTVGCARCHDHKFDPIPQTDYYRLLSTFTTTVRSEPELDLDPGVYLKAKAAFDREHEPLVEALQRFEKATLPLRLEQWLKSGAPLPKPAWNLLDLASAQSQGGASFTNLGDGSFLATGANPKFDTNVFTARTPIQGIRSVRLEALAHKSLPKEGPGRAGNGNLALTDFRLTAAPLDGKRESVEVKLINPRATFEQSGFPVRGTIDGDPKSAWAVDTRIGTNHAAVFDLESPVGFPGGTLLTFTLKFENNEGHNLGRPRLAVSTLAPPVDLAGEQAPHSVAEIRHIVERPAAERTLEQTTALLKYYRSIDPELQKRSAAVDEHARQAPKKQLTKVMVSTEGLPAVRLHTQGGDFFEKTYFLKRGDLSQKQGEAAPGFLQVLMRTPEREKRWQQEPPKGWRTSYRRLALARWISDSDAGAGNLLARVIVNRLWQHHLGRGIVDTPSDFGVQGERPTHPELLDWLASELIRQGWRLKAIHKLIMTSAVYTQGSEVDEAKVALDPENRLLWRRQPQRLEAEAIRDAMLAVSGTLDPRMYGPGSLEETQRRRSIYFMMKRSKLIPMMSLFDAPDGLQGIGRRPTTTVAPQALALMNNENIQAFARALARRIEDRAGDPPAARVREGYLLSVGRLPTPAELADSLGFLEQQAESYRAGKKGAAAGLALADFCQALLSLNEFVYVD